MALYPHKNFISNFTILSLFNAKKFPQYWHSYKHWPKKKRSSLLQSAKCKHIFHVHFIFPLLLIPLSQWLYLHFRKKKAKFNKEEHFLFSQTLAYKPGNINFLKLIDYSCICLLSPWWVGGSDILRDLVWTKWFWNGALWDRGLN